MRKRLLGCNCWIIVLWSSCNPWPMPLITSKAHPTTKYTSSFSSHVSFAFIGVHSRLTFKSRRWVSVNLKQPSQCRPSSQSVTCGSPSLHTTVNRQSPDNPGRGSHRVLSGHRVPDQNRPSPLLCEPRELCVRHPSCLQMPLPEPCNRLLT